MRMALILRHDGRMLFKVYDIPQKERRQIWYLRYIVFPATPSVWQKPRGVLPHL